MAEIRRCFYEFVSSAGSEGFAGGHDWLDAVFARKPVFWVLAITPYGKRVGLLCCFCRGARFQALPLDTPVGAATNQAGRHPGRRASPNRRSGAAFWGDQGEGGDSGKHGDVLLGERQKRSLGDAVRSSDVVAVVGKRFARGKGRELADNAFALDDDTLVLGIGDDPFTPLEGDGYVRFVVDSDEVNEGVGALGGRVQMRREDDAVHGDSEIGQFVDHGGDVGKRGNGVKCERIGAGGQAATQ